MTDAEPLYYGLLIRCPFKEEKRNRPLRSFRTGSISERLNAASALTVNERITLINQHRKCLASREKPGISGQITEDIFMYSEKI